MYSIYWSLHWEVKFEVYVCVCLSLSLFLHDSSVLLHQEDIRAPF